MEHVTILNMMHNKLKEVQRHFPFRQAHILRLRFGLNEETRTHTLEEVGRMFNVTRERIRQIEKQALSRLKNSPHVDGLRDYLHA